MRVVTPYIELYSKPVDIVKVCVENLKNFSEVCNKRKKKSQCTGPLEEEDFSGQRFQDVHLGWSNLRQSLYVTNKRR